jgi:hypothetical protein
VIRLRSALWLPVVLAGALGTQGCATAILPALSALGTVVTLASWTNAQEKNGHAGVEAESYRQGVRDTLEKFQRNGLPVVASARQPENLYYVGPVMQEIWVPAQVVGGMVIPAHWQWVVVRPGTWQVPGASRQPGGKQGPF